jgi:DMSO/TMAO reductase YedYZ heme-binding membrane subunit
MPGTKTTNRLRVFAIRAALGIWALFVTAGAVVAFASRSTVNHLTGVLHDNLNEGKNNYDTIKVHPFDGIPDLGLGDVLGSLFDHWFMTLVFLAMAVYIWRLRRSHKKAAAAAPHSSTS